VYTQVLDASVRTAVAKVRDEMFTIVHKPETASRLTHMRKVARLRLDSNEQPSG